MPTSSVPASTRSSGWQATGAGGALGLRHPDARTLDGIPRSTAHTGAAQQARLAALGLRCVTLPVLRDVDTVEDACAVAAEAPGSAFAVAFEPQLRGAGGGAANGSASCLRAVGGEVLPLDVDRWLAAVTPEDEALLDLAEPPVLDVGCGPGRHVLELSRRGRPALGVEASPHATVIARRQGARVLERSIFDGIPGAGRWGSALLLDGSIGIGGRPRALLRRIRSLLRTGGAVLAELEPPGRTGRHLTVRAECAGSVGGRFPWATVGVNDAPQLAREAGLVLEKRWRKGERWFARFEVP